MPVRRHDRVAHAVHALQTVRARDRDPGLGLGRGGRQGGGGAVSEDGNPNIRVEITDATEFHCFRLVLEAAVEADGERHPIEIMFHARSLVDLIHKCSLALCDWQTQTTGYLIERLTRP
jgi:hypothetical protein